MNPYLSDADFTLYNGDAREVLRELPAESVHMCVTSPPFFGLRDYQTGTWEGGDAECDHKRHNRADQYAEKHTNATGTIPGVNKARRSEFFEGDCGKCGARRIDRQIGLESTPEEWVAQLVSVFEEVKRVLRKDGTLWVECGDSYAQGGGAAGSEKQASNVGSLDTTRRASDYGLKPKDLIGQPFLLAFALREVGWYWRNVCIWHKPNPMPESVRDRFTVSHSYVLLFSKSPRYFFDAEAVREPFDHGTNKNDGHGFRWNSPRYVGQPDVMPNHTLDGSDGDTPRGPDGRRVTTVKAGDNSIQHRDGERWPNSGRNARSVWTIATEPLPFEHYAAFPQALAERCIKAGTSERGCCPECGAPWVREVESELVKSPVHGSGSTVRGRGEGTETNGWAGEAMPRLNRQTATVGWRPSCDHGHAPIPASVLDCFLGSGTTALVARRLGRKCIGIELNEKYCELAAERTKQLSLLSEDASPEKEMAVSE